MKLAEAIAPTHPFTYPYLFLLLLPGFQDDEGDRAKEMEAEEDHTGEEIGIQGSACHALPY